MMEHVQAQVEEKDALIAKLQEERNRLSELIVWAQQDQANIPAEVAKAIEEIKCNN